MGYRRKARECALQMLFQLDVTDDETAAAQRAYWTANPAPDPVRIYADRIVEGTRRDLVRIDAHLSRAAENWRLDRMAIVDRSVMRMAVYEFLHESKTPAAVVINEALEIVKKFSSEDSAHFVNGILDHIKGELEGALPRAAKT